MAEPTGNGNGTGADAGAGNGGAGGAAGGDANGGGAGAANNNGNAADANQNVDLSKLSAEQIEKALENPDLWKTPRLKQLLEDQKAYKKSQEDAAAANEQKLKDDKKWEELAATKDAESKGLKEQLQNAKYDQALTNKLVAEKVVDLDAALKLVDRSKLTVGDDGSVTGVDDVVASLKSGKAYLFTEGGGTTTTTVGAANNAGNGSENAGQMQFKRSQLKDPAFYQANREQIVKAAAAGLIEDDVSPKN